MNGIKRKRGRPSVEAGPIQSGDVTIPLRRWMAYGSFYICDREDRSRRVYYHTQAMRDAALKKFREIEEKEIL